MIDNAPPQYGERLPGYGQPAASDFEYGAKLTEMILLGCLAERAGVGKKVEWDAKNLKVTNLDALKTPGVADLVKPKYPAGYRLD